MRNWHSASIEPLATAGGGDRREAIDAGQRFVEIVHVLRAFQSLPIVAGFLLHFVRFAEKEPTVRREVTGQMVAGRLHRRAGR